MKFRCRDTGQILSQQQVKRTRCNNAFRTYTDEQGKVSRRPMILTFPRTQEQWLEPGFLDRAAIDPVHVLPMPENTELERAELGEVELVEGRWQQGWVMVPRYESLEAWQAATLSRIRSTASARRNTRISVNGVSVRTDEKGIALIAAAVQIGGDRAWVSGDEVVQLTQGQVLEIRDAVNAYVQACFDREAELITLVRQATVMQDVPVDEGWPYGG